MVTSKAATVAQYIDDLPDNRREIVEAIRKVVNDNLPKGYQEAMQYGMIGWSVPHALYPAGYHTDPAQPLPLAALASQKQYVSLYLMGTYLGSSEEATLTPSDSSEMSWFRQAWQATGRKLNMGKSCIRIKKMDDIAFDVIGDAVRRLPVSEYIALYESVRPAPKAKGKAAPKSGAGSKT